MVRLGTVRFGMVRFGTVRFGAVWKNENKMNKFLKYWDMIARALILIFVVILLYVLVTNIEYIKLMGGNACVICDEQTSCDCWCFKYPHQDKSVRASLQDMPINPKEICANLSLEDTAKCFTTFIRIHYNYIKQEDNPNRTIEDILENGGDCYDYTRILRDIALDMGLKAYKDNTIDKHTFLIIEDESGYCIIDQIIYWCVEFKQNDK